MMALLLNANDSVSRSYSITKPSPLHPVAAEGVGVRTGNLFNRAGTYSAGAFNNVYLISGLDTSLSYTCSTSLARISGAQAACIYFSQSTSISSATNGVWSGEEKTFTPNENGELYVHVRNTAASGAPAVADDVIAGNITIMLNTGSTAQPFEPYGVKIPITCGGQTTNIYLGSASTTRRVKKLVLTGEETDWLKASSTYAGCFYKSTALSAIQMEVYCTHLPYIAVSNFEQGTITISASKRINLWFPQFTSSSTVDDFKTYLAQQYANGTPVTIWYILATPEIAATNEPLMKIGDYADEISVTGLPTLNGITVYDCDLEVKPSKMYVKYRKHGT